MEAVKPTKTTERSPQAKRRLGQIYALLLQLEDAETPEANAAKQSASGAGHGAPGKAHAHERL